MSSTHEQDRRVKLVEILKMGIDPFAQPLCPVISIFAARAHNPDNSTSVTVGGRIFLRRGMGKLSFITLRDKTGHIQLALDKSKLSEKEWQLSRLLDLGDHIIVQGVLGTTQTGEITVWVRNLHIASKALLPPPDKVDGLKDPETRSRNRHVDLFTNEQTMQLMVNRSKIISAIRSFMTGRGFMEVDTPILHPVASGAAAKPFVTHHNALNEDMYLRIAPELYLKRLLIGGMERIFEIGKNFRNEGISPKHNPEFTSLEAYQMYSSHHGMQKLVEEMICFVAKQVFQTLKFQCGDAEIDLTPPWRRARMYDVVNAHISPNRIEDPNKLLEVYENEVEATLMQPTFVTHFPARKVPLAKSSDDYAEAFELVIAGQELAPGYSEQNDPDCQLVSLIAQESMSGEKHVNDKEFVEALKYGMPPAGGLGLGIDRLVAIMTNQHNIREVIPFPTMRRQ